MPKFDEMSSSTPVTVSAAQFVRHFGELRDQAMNGPVYISHHGRRTHVLLSNSLFETLIPRTDEQEDMAQNADRLHILVEQIDACLAVLDETGRIRSLNTAALGYFSGAAKLLVGTSSSNDLPELNDTVAQVHLKRALLHGERASFEMPAISHPGQWLRCAIFPYGEGAAFLFRNVTAERHSSSREQRLKSLEQALDAGPAIGRAELTLRGTLRLVSSALAGMIGLRQASLERVRLTDILPLNRRVELAAHIEAVLAGDGARAVETALLANDGKERPVMMSLAPLHQDHEITGATLVVSLLQPH